jgi:hypothetical protein
MKKRTIAVIAFMALLLAACNFPMVRDTEEDLADAVAQTVEALEAELDQPELIIPTVEPVLPTTTPMPTVEVKPTETTVPCLFAAFVTETVKDNTKFSPGESFTKSWTLKNTGSCTWTTGYRIVFSSGNQMGGPDKQNLPTAVKPGETVKIDVDLTAPAATGTYKGTWKLRTDKGVDFGLPNGIWVQIVVE